MVKLLSIKKTPSNSLKKYIAEFDNGKHIQFGSKTSTTYSEGATEQKRDAYIARHRVNEDFSKINPASLSRYILWSAKTLAGGIKNFKNKFNC